MRLYIKSTALLSLGVAAAFGISACGGDSSPETPIVVTGQTETLTKAEFITQADALCDTVNSQITDIANAGEGITRAADVAALRTGLVSDIRDLGTPVDDGSSSSSTSTGVSTTTTPDVSTFPGDTSDTSTTTDTTSTTTDTTASSVTGTGNDLEDFLTALGAEAKAGEKIDLANQRGEDTSAGEAELNDAKDKAATAAEAYGFTICGTDGTTTNDTSQDPSISTDSSSGTSSAAPSTVTPVAPSTSSSGGSSSSPSTGSSSSGSSSSGSSGSTSGGGVSAGGGVGPG